MKKNKTFNYTFDLQQPPPVHSLEQMLDSALRLHQQGALQKAEQSYRRLLQVQPAHAYVLNLLGVLLSQKGNHQEGEKLIAKAIGLDPEVADYHNNLGLARQQQGKLEEAAQSFRRAIQINPRLANAWLCLGNVSMHLEGPQTAIDAFQKAISINPDYLPAYNNLGNLYSKTRQYAKAHQILGKVVELKPDFADAWYNIGVVNMAEKNGAEAIVAFNKAITLKPGYFEAYSKRGHCRNVLFNDWEGALRDFEQAISLNPAYIQAHLARADIYRQQEDLHRTEEILNYTLVLMDDAGMPEGNNANKFSYNRDSYNYLFDKGKVHFMLGDTFNKQKEYDKALSHYKKANSLHGKLVTYDRDAHEKMIDAVINVFAADFFAEHAAPDTKEQLPIVIAGLSRAGKTLTEGCVAGHPQVMAGGELGYFTRIGNDANFFFETDKPWPYCCRSLNADTVQTLIAEYLELLRGYSSTARFVTDTSPGNYLFLGLIRLLFPTAPIIHCRRDPLDLCLSIYFKGYKNIYYHRHAYDLINIGHYYLQYSRLMAHWRKVLPGPPMMESRYEELTGDFETHKFRLMQSCGLNPDEAGEGSSPVPGQESAGINYGQDPQPIHNSYIHFSKHYEEFVGPLKEMIANAAMEE